ncbi:MAG: DUF4880 domain-containing protein [Sphingomonadales bacterium]|nr:MAG: DUF4880 domain-containing protein [Sphingomonadales bacterium]TNF03414.1 MAG: DUF4880 domain-containing protein [Sphingomonadales bacterium]
MPLVQAIFDTGRWSIASHRAYDSEQLAEEAACWLVRHDLGTAERAEFERWRAQSPAHAIAFARAWAAWETANEAQGDDDVVGPASEVVPAGVSVAEPSRRYFLRTAAAAGIVMVAGAGLFASRAYAWDHAETQVGESRRIYMPDGSEMMLNTDSAVAWKFDGDRRIIRLERGEVALDIHPGPAALSLIGKGLTASLSAGRFNARLKAGALDVLVLRGVAQALPYSAGKPVAQASAGQAQTLLMTDVAPSVRPVSGRQMAATLAWQDGEILFQDEPLSSAVEEYNRYLASKIVIMDSGLGGIRVGGRFTSADPSAFLTALRTTLDIDVQAANGSYFLTIKK